MTDAVREEADLLVAKKSRIMLSLGLGRITAQWSNAYKEIAEIDARMKELRDLIEAEERAR
jgi:hypothetical protein